MPWFLLLPSSHVNAIFSCLSFCRSSMSARHGNNSTLSNVRLAQGSLCVAPWFFSACRQSARRDPHLAEERRCLPIASSNRRGMARLRCWPFRVHSGVAHFIFYLRAKNRCRAPGRLFAVLETWCDSVGTDLNRSWFHILQGTRVEWPGLVLRIGSRRRCHPQLFFGLVYQGNFATRRVPWRDLRDNGWLRWPHHRVHGAFAVAEWRRLSDDEPARRNHAWVRRHCRRENAAAMGLQRSESVRTRASACSCQTPLHGDAAGGTIAWHE